MLISSQSSLVKKNKIDLHQYLLPGPHQTQSAERVVFSDQDNVVQIYMPKMISHRSLDSSTEEVAEISMRQRVLNNSSMDVET